MLKILQARLQQYMNQELPDVQAEFRESRGTRDKLQTFTGSLKKQENFWQISIFASLIKLKSLRGSQKTGKSLEMEWIQDHLTCHLRNLYASQEKTGPDMEKWTCSKLDQEYIKSVYCPHAG